MDQIDSRVQKLSNNLWTSTSLRPKDVSSQTDRMPAPTIWDVLSSERTSEECAEGTHLLLKHLWEAGYKVSRKQAQICQPKVKYLGFHIPQEMTCLGNEQKQVVCSISGINSHYPKANFRVPENSRILLNLDPNFAVIAKLPYKATKQGEWDLLKWGGLQKKPFKDLKQTLSQAQALGLPNLNKLFFICMREMAQQSGCSLRC
jgi:hypothetical protein